MSNIKSMTKAQLIEHIARQDQELIAAGRKLEELRLAVSVASVQPARIAGEPKPQPGNFEGYWDYVRAARKWCYANNKPVSYLPREQFEAAEEFSHA